MPKAALLCRILTLKPRPRFAYITLKCCLPLQGTRQLAATIGLESAAYLGKYSTANLDQTVVNSDGRILTMGSGWS